MKTNPLLFLQLILCLLYFPNQLNSQENTLSNSSIARAVIFSVSAYHDTLFPTLPDLNTDAEHFAAFLHSRHGGKVHTEHIKLTTGKEATLANLASISNWLQEDCQPGDHVILYLSFYARLLTNEEEVAPYLFFADSPFAPAGAGALTMSSLLYSIQEISAKNSLSFQLYLNLVIDPAENEEIWKQWLVAFEKSFPKAFFSISNGSKKNRDPQNLDPFRQSLIKGLMGEADYDGNGIISPDELIKLFKKRKKTINNGKIFFSAFSSAAMNIGIVNKNIFNKPNNIDQFPVLVNMETSSLEDSLLKHENTKTKQQYQDFIISMKLGHFLTPPGKCASDLYDSLSIIPSLSPLYRHWQRKLATALLDETQQALNAYLKTDSKELMRRWKHAKQYDIYPEYIERAIELIGPKSFMSDILQTKLYYFKGLKYRLDGEKNNNIEDLKTAIKMQEKAISYEPEAAFVLNEIGVLLSRLDSSAADAYFIEALKYSPTWVIPMINLSILYQNKNMLDKAMYYALQSIETAPENEIALHNIGVIYFKMSEYVIAEKFFMNTISLDIKNEEAYYNLSCTKAQQEDYNSAIKWLEKAVQFGFDSWEKIEKDPDLTEVIKMDQYETLKRKYKKS